MLMTLEVMRTMTRLIDADALIDTLYDHEFTSYIDKGEVSTVINDEPTVEAIPIEWISKKFDELCNDAKPEELVMAIFFRAILLDGWEAEQEKEDVEKDN